MTQSLNNIPQHIAIVMDGNGRWAQQRGKKRNVGHKAGVDTVKKIVEACAELEVGALTLFAFSSENWRRPEEEVSLLMSLFLVALEREIKQLHKNGIKLQFIGDRSRFSEKLQRSIADAEALTRENTRLSLSIAANYGGRWDIVNAAAKMAEQVQQGKLLADDIDENCFSSFTSLSHLPEVDLFIRTGGESRISNFLLWQIAYSELYFTPVLWPDFDREQLMTAIASFSARERRYGQTSEQVR